MKYATFIIAIALGACPIFASAQENGPPELSNERMKEIEAQRSAYITAALSLTPEEAQRFWPLFNEMSDKRQALRKEDRELHRSLMKNEMDPTEAEAEATLEKSLTIRARELDLERTYTERFKKAIGAVKTVKLDKAERDFHREVLRKYKEQMEDRSGPPSPRGGKR
jgi:Spy/CpxP family protein refolding chaperone